MKYGWPDNSPPTVLDNSLGCCHGIGLDGGRVSGDKSEFKIGKYEGPIFFASIFATKTIGEMYQISEAQICLSDFFRYEALSVLNVEDAP